MGGAGRWWKWPARALVAALGVVLAMQAWYLGWIVYWRWHDPAPTAFMKLDLERSAGHRRVQQRQWVDYARISPELKRAVVASEDANFTRHDGVDWTAMHQAWEDNARRGRSARGGSTISQQLAKNLFLSPRRSYVRKAQELAIAFMIEAVWNKRRILEVYLNVVEWGDGVFGAEAAARHYYGLPAAALGPGESARLAAMLPSPRYFDRHRDVPYLEQRAQAILVYQPETAIP